MGRLGGTLTTIVIALSLPLGAGGLSSLRAQAEGDRPFLLALRGEAVVVNYSPGALDRAHHVQQRLELLTEDASRWMNTELRLRVFVLDRREWSEMGIGLPYGLPTRLAGNVLAVPAAGDDGTVTLWTRLCGEPPPPLPGRPLQGTAEEASSLALSDLLAEVEAARTLLSLAGIRGETAWVHQVMAHLLALAAFERYERARLDEIEEFFATLGRGVDETPSLARYTEGVELATLLWFESRFHAGARLVLDNGKKNEAKALLRLARRSGGILERAVVVQRYPALGAWLRETFPTATP